MQINDALWNQPFLVYVEGLLLYLYERMQFPQWNVNALIGSELSVSSEMAESGMSHASYAHMEAVVKFIFESRQ